MSVTKSDLEGIISKLKKHSAKDNVVEITFWKAYNVSEAYNSFWARQYLDLYIYMLEAILNLYDGDELSSNPYFKDEDIDNIFSKSKELLFYLTKLPYEFLS